MQDYLTIFSEEFVRKLQSRPFRRTDTDDPPRAHLLRRRNCENPDRTRALNETPGQRDFFDRLLCRGGWDRRRLLFRNLRRGHDGRERDDGQRSRHGIYIP